MEALVTAFVAAGIGEWGDKTQLLVALLVARSGRPVTVLLALFLAAAISSGAAAFAGALIAPSITIRAMTLMVALALLSAGLTGLIRRKAPSTGSGRAPLFIAALLLCLAAEMGDRTQFLTFALSGRFGTPSLAAAGATAGIVTAALPAALLASRFETTLPVRGLRLAGAILFLIIGFVTAVSALRLT